MSNETGSKRLERWGLAATKIYLIALIGGVPVLAYLGAIKLDSLELNELGDFLAGAFGPLAIFWLVLGFFQQGEELRNSVKTLELQARELANSVRQQQELVEVTRDQFQHEKELVSVSEQRRLEADKPHLKVSFGPIITRGNEQAKYRLSVRNVGQAASSTEIEAFIDSTKIGWRSVDYMESGHSADIDVFNNSYVPLLNTEMSVNISVTSSSGSRWQMQYLLAPDENHPAKGFILRDTRSEIVAQANT